MPMMVDVAVGQGALDSHGPMVPVAGTGVNGVGPHCPERRVPPMVLRVSGGTPHLKPPVFPELRARTVTRPGSRRPGLAALALATLAFGGCAPDSGETLVVYTPHGRDLLAHFGERFEAEHPGVRIEWLDMGSQEVLDRLRSERTNPQADVWWGAPAEIFAAGGEDGLLEPFRPSWADQLPDDARDPDDLWFATYLTPEVIAYNAAALSPDEAPREWDDILEPRWRDQVLIREPLASGTMRAIFSSIIYRESGGTGDPEAGFEWLLRLDAQTKEYVLNPTLLYQKLARQEGLVTLWAMPDIEHLQATTDFPIDYVIPASGTPVVVDGIAVVRGTRNPELARAFVEFAGGEEAILDAAEQFFRIPARGDLDPDRLPAWLREALPLIRPMEVDAALLREKTPEWMRYWDSNIRRQGRAQGFE
jgi:iron(III) transport system substrate-binding protein